MRAPPAFTVKIPVLPRAAEKAVQNVGPRTHSAEDRKAAVDLIQAELSLD